MSKITCCSLSQLKQVSQGNDINLFIVRNPKNEIMNLTWFPYLAPSQVLYSFAMENKDSSGWWDIYKQSFEEELESADKKLGLGLVQDYIILGFNVNLVCYCSSAEQCHRSLVGAKLQSMGLEVIII